MDALMPFEVAGLLHQGAPGFVEFALAISSKVSGRAEWIVTQVLGAEIALEDLGNLRVELGLDTEAQSLVGSDKQLLIELLLSPRSAARLVSESLASGAQILTDGPFCLEWADPPSAVIVAFERLLRSPGKVRILAGLSSVHPLRGQ
jgi:hypothetical protein